LGEESRYIKNYQTLFAILIGVLTVSQSYAQNVSFVVGSDNREFTTQYCDVLCDTVPEL